jgi:hypothetical protein
MKLLHHQHHHYATTVVILPMLLAGLLLVMAHATPVLAEKERMGSEVGGVSGDREKAIDPRNGGYTETRNPPPPSLIGRDEHQQDHSCGGDSMHHQFPWYVEQSDGKNFVGCCFVCVCVGRCQ